MVMPLKDHRAIFCSFRLEVRDWSPQTTEMLVRALSNIHPSAPLQTLQISFNSMFRNGNPTGHPVGELAKYLGRGVASRKLVVHFDDEETQFRGLFYKHLQKSTVFPRTLAISVNRQNKKGDECRHFTGLLEKIFLSSGLCETKNFLLVVSIEGGSWHIQNEEDTDKECIKGIVDCLEGSKLEKFCGLGVIREMFEQETNYMTYFYNTAPFTIMDDQKEFETDHIEGDQ